MTPHVEVRARFRAALEERQGFHDAFLATEPLPPTHTPEGERKDPAEVKRLDDLVRGLGEQYDTAWKAAGRPDPRVRAPQILATCASHSGILLAESSPQLEARIDDG
jgi:hypothetical protein